MELFKKIKAWFARQNPEREADNKRQASAPVSKKTKKVVVHSAPLETRAETPIVVPNSQVTMTVRYELKDGGGTLASPITISGKPGDPFTPTFRTIDGYVLAQINGYIPRFGTTSSTLTFEYLPRVAGPVTILHRKETGELLADPEIIAGRLNAEFTVWALPEYRKQVTGDPSFSGRFTEESQTIRFTYHADLLEFAQEETEEYAQVVEKTVAFAHPGDITPLETPLPQGSFWRVFGFARERGERNWVNLGGNLWVLASAIRLQDSNPFLAGPSVIALPNLTWHYDETPTPKTARLVSGQDGITRWDKPYGRMLSQRLQDGESIRITHTATTDDGVSWLRLDDDSYILADFLA